MLEATHGLNGSTGGADITIVDDSALMSDNTALSGGEAFKEHNGAENINIYVVRKGDTLSSIAKMFNVSVNTIKWGNDLANGVISEGQTLVILPVSGVKHTVKLGDTLKSIAAKYSGDVDEIISYNNLSLDTKLAVGDVIIVPDGKISTTPAKGSVLTSKPRNTTNLPAYSGYYLRPIEGGVKTQGIHGYNGVDLASSLGAPIYAAAAGTVVISRSSGWNGGYGQYIVIAHSNGTQTLYAHLSKNNVYSGSYVTQGQVIGAMGRTGKATGVHLHFEIRGAVNPF